MVGPRAEPGAETPGFRTLSLSLAATGAGLRWSGRLEYVSLARWKAVLRFGFRAIFDGA